MRSRPRRAARPTRTRSSTLYWLVLGVARRSSSSASRACSSTRSSSTARARARSPRRSTATPGWRSAGRSAPRVILVVLATFTFVKLPADPQPAELRRRGLELAGGTSSPPDPRRSCRPTASRWPSTSTASSTSGATRTRRLRRHPAERAVHLRGDGRAGRRRRSRWTSAPRTSPTPGGSRSSAASSTRSPATRTTRGSRSRPADGTVFRGQCAELCGRNHANMIAPVRAVTPDRFEPWLQRKKAQIKAADAAAQRQRRQVERSLNPVPDPPSPHRMAADHHDHRTEAILPAPQIRSRTRRRARAHGLDLAGSPRPTTSGSGSCTWSRRSSSSSWAGSRRCSCACSSGQADNTLLDPQTYNQLFTMHGTTMIFLFVVPIMGRVRQLPSCR